MCLLIMYSKRKATTNNIFFLFLLLLALVFVDFAPNQTLHMNPFWDGEPLPQLGSGRVQRVLNCGSCPRGSYAVFFALTLLLAIAKN